MPVPSVTQATTASPRAAPKRHSAQAAALPSFSTMHRQVDRGPAGQRAAARRARPGAGRTAPSRRRWRSNPRRRHPTAATSCRAGSAWTTSTMADSVGMRRRGPGVARRSRSMHDAGLVDHAGRDLRAADVDADGQGHARLGVEVDLVHPRLVLGAGAARGPRWRRRARRAGRRSTAVPAAATRSVTSGRSPRRTATNWHSGHQSHTAACSASPAGSKLRRTQSWTAASS